MSDELGIVDVADRPAALVRHLRWLEIQDCICPYRWGGLGTLYGISMGQGWIRTSTDAGCAHHGKR